MKNILEKYNFIQSRYLDGNLAIGIESYDEEFKCMMPFGTLTVNLHPSSPNSNLAYIDVNSPGVKKIADGLEENNLIRNTGNVCKSGFVTYPLYEFTDKFLSEVCVKPEGMEE